MTRLGKVLVFFNLAFGLLLAGWAFNLYANGIDWSDRKAGPVPVGEYARREAQLAELWEGVPKAQANWLARRRQLLDDESRLVADRVWYDKEMQHLFKDANKDKPVEEILIADKDDDKTGVRKGQILLDDKGLPKRKPLVDRANKPLQALAEYNKQDDDLLKSLREVLENHEKQIVEANAAHRSDHRGQGQGHPGLAAAHPRRAGQGRRCAGRAEAGSAAAHQHRGRGGADSQTQESDGKTDRGIEEDKHRQQVRRAGGVSPLLGRSNRGLTPPARPRSDVDTDRG